MLPKAKEFSGWALLRANPDTVPEGSALAVPADKVGTAPGGPWVYLMGTTGNKVTKALLEERWKNYYSKHGWTREEYDRITAGWVEEGKTATDCEGLADCFLNVDVNADYNYRSWCTEKGRISEIDRPYVYGEAVFRANSEGRMVHVGFVCGFINGDPLIVEAKGLRYGVVVTKLKNGAWTHRGLMTKVLSYKENPTVKPRFDIVTSPMSTDEAYRAMQHAMNAAGYTDDKGRALNEDGKWGNCSLQAFRNFLADYMTKPETKPLEISVAGKCVLKYDVLEGDE